MKKMLLATALAPGHMSAQQTFTVQNKPAAVAPKETITHHFFVSGIGQKKLSMQPKFVAAQKMLLKQKPSNIRKWIARFYYFRYLYSAGSACIAHIVRVAHRYGQPSIALLINILGSFQLFLHSDQPSLRVK